ncbi:MAG TPA: discoidin domain-containing protein [Spirochaetia bacterium]|nr:discoidin domain-containing protein [Spirochaetia bacterium]
MNRSFLSLTLGALAVGVLALSCATTPTGPAAAAAPPAPENLAYGKYSTSNNHIFDFTADRATDGDVLSYWEGAANSYPNDYTLDLGQVQDIGRLVIRLNPKRIWQPRTQTFEILTSADGSNFSTLAASKDYDFDPIDSDNSVTIAVQAKTQYLRLRFTANTEATGGQMAELEVYGK